MRREDYLVFGDVNTKDFAVGIYGNALASAPERDQEFVKVPGRNGDLILDNGRYNNITISYKAYIIDNYNVNIAGLRNALLDKTGYSKLQDTVNPDEYRYAKALPFDVDEYGILRAGEFTMKFNCKPQRYLVEGDKVITLTSASSILNPHKQTALPLIRAYGTGSFSIGSVTVTINSSNSYTDIDCELQEAYKDTLATNCNGNISLTNGQFPSLVSGLNSISLSGISKLEITPRWWRL